MIIKLPNRTIPSEEYIGCGYIPITVDGNEKHTIVIEHERRFECFNLYDEMQEAAVAVKLFEEALAKGEGEAALPDLETVREYIKKRAQAAEEMERQAEIEQKKQEEAWNNLKEIEKKIGTEKFIEWMASIE